MNRLRCRRPGINSRPCHPTAALSGDPVLPHDDLLFGRHDSPTTDRVVRGAAHRADVVRSDATLAQSRKRQAAG